MRSHILFASLISLSTLSIPTLSLANELPAQQQLDVHGTLRFQYTYNDYLPNSGNTIDFSDAVLWLNYNNGPITGHLDYRLYEAYDKIGGLNYPVNAWLAYTTPDHHQVKLGLQAVPIGASRYLSSAYNLTQLYRLGLEEVNHWGISYNYQPENFNLSLGYYFSEPANQSGKSEDSSHYSSFVTSSSNVPNGTELEGKQSYAIKLDKTFDYELNDQNIKTRLGASYYYSELKNLKNNKNGDRQVWTVFHDTNIDRFNFNLTYGRQVIDHKDDAQPNLSTFGFFDGSYNVANKGDFLATEINYTLPVSTKNWSEPKLYSSYSRYFKDQAGFKDSERLIYGVYTKYKDNFQFYLENIQARNDVGFGAANGYAEGENATWNSMVFLSLGYYF